MLRFKLLLTLVFIGLFYIYQSFPFRNRCVGIINGIISLVSIIVYLIIWAYEVYLNKDETKYLKKAFDKSSIYITISLLLLFAISQLYRVNLSKTVLEANNNPNGYWGSYDLELKKNMKYKLTHHMDETCYYFGEYTFKNDTLILKDYYDLDIVLFFDEDKNEIIPISDNKELFITEKPFIISNPIIQIE